VHGYAGIKERIAELKEQNGRRAQLTRDELLAFYAEVIRTPADQVAAGSPVIQSYETTENGHKIRIADKIAAGAALSRMTGWNSPERLEVSSDSLGSYLLELRAKSLFDERAVPIERPVLSLGNGENGSDRQSANE
jgi:hypothetical protein